MKLLTELSPVRPRRSCILQPTQSYMSSSSIYLFFINIQERTHKSHTHLRVKCSHCSQPVKMISSHKVRDDIFHNIITNMTKHYWRSFQGACYFSVHHKANLTCHLLIELARNICFSLASCLSRGNELAAYISKPLVGRFALRINELARDRPTTQPRNPIHH